MRLARPITLTAALVAGLALAGCATAGAAAPQGRAGARLPAHLPAPRTSGEAQAYLAGSLAAMRAGKPEHAALFLDAMLHSDHLTDRGRANVYWFAAEAHRQAGQEDALVDALGGFLVAVEVVPADDEMLRRAVDARAMLLARKLKTHPLLGKSPGAAIPVEDARDPSGLVAELGCVEDAVSTVPGAGGRRLEERRVICNDTGESLVLFFDVTHAGR